MNKNELNLLYRSDVIQTNSGIADKAKIQLKSDNIIPFGGLFSIFRQFSSSGLRQTIDLHLGKRGKTDAAFTYGDIFASLFSSYLCCGDCVEDVMSVKEFWDGRGRGR